ncbi:lytic polysaccharide monooxygenase [Paenibacillus selenitireducens]|uniref:lytic polysaccharide monooxygenase n=1 Tax=Paenibacillus selenitireducens TaxID=1324314 RepID=UPI0009989401|nr:lytic polysaccharide monooxygenase [Paenibacillus selenitireducens]
MTSSLFRNRALHQKTKFIATFGFILVGLACSLAFAKGASAHGYIESPSSRAALCATGVNKDCGPTQYEPQSVEGKGGFPASGPVDGQITGGGKYPELYAQTPTRWSKVTLKGGKNTFTWKLTAPHSTAEWKYYITKKDWDTNKPLARQDLELLATFNDGGAMPSPSTSHVVELPTDRSGYYLVLGVWEIADTGNAFYQVIDVNLVNDGTGPSTQPPTVPGQVVSTAQTTSSITLQWSASIASEGIKNYEVYRNGKLVGTPSQTTYTDTGLTANTAYNYTIKAVDNKGNVSPASATVTAQTLKEDTVIPVTPPTGLHAHMSTKNSIMIMWSASTATNGIKNYEIYRNGTLVGTATETMYDDTGLTANTSYTYTVRAVDTLGNKSQSSAALTAATLPDSGGGNLPAWDATKIYVAGDKVQYDGLEYQASYWTQNNRPDSSDAWKLLSNATPEWNSTKAYTGGSKVTYNGIVYEAKWWTKGEQPDQSDVWKAVQN